MRAQLANTVDVSTLVEWIRRNGEYEEALRGLYKAVDASGGTQTAKVRDAMAAERKARRDLPQDARGLVVIMAEIGRGGLNGAVITIEEARGQPGQCRRGPRRPIAVGGAGALTQRGRPGPDPGRGDRYTAHQSSRPGRPSCRACPQGGPSRHASPRGCRPALGRPGRCPRGPVRR